MSAKYKSPSFLLPNELNTSANPLNTDGDPATGTGINSLYSMDFDGSNDFIDAGNNSSLNITSNITLSVWVKPTTAITSQNFAMFVAKGINSDYMLFSNSSTGTARMRLGSSFLIDSVSTISTNVWTHIVGTYDGSNLKIYLNGSLDNTVSQTGAIPSTSGSLQIGAANSANRFNGQIDEVAIFNRALNSTEIAALYDGSGSSIRPSNLMATNLGPIAYYPLGEQAQNSGYLSATGNEWQFPNGVLQDYVMDFDGGDNISSSLSLNGASSFTVSVWFNPTTLSGSKYMLGQWQDGDQSNSTWAIATVDALLYFFIQDNTGTKVISTNQSIGVWTNAIAIYTGSSIKLYVNNILINTVSTGSLNSGSKSFRIGDDFNGGNGFDGKISNVAVWNTAITDAAQIANIYNNGSPQTTYTVTPQNWWKLNATSVYTPSVPNYTTALDFDNSPTFQGVIYSPTSLPSTSSWSVSFWAVSTGSTKQWLWSGVGAGIHIDNVNIRFTGTAAGDITMGLIPFSKGDLFHMLASYDGSTLKVYIDGSEFYSGSVTTNISTDYTTIGGWNRYGYPTGNVYYGYSQNDIMSNFAVWDSALTASQVSTIFNFGTPETNISFSPRNYYKLDNTTTGLNDLGSGGANAFISGTGITQVNSSIAVIPSWKIPTALTIPTINYKTAGSFNGTSSKIVTTEENLGTTNTISFWHKRPTGMGANKVVIGGNTLNRFDGTIILNSYQLIIGFPTDKALFFTSDIFIAANNASDVNIPYEDVWVHYCITRNGTTQNDIKLYVNSYLVTSSKSEPFGAVDYTTNTTILNLGAAPAQSLFSEGELSNISTFSSAFTQAQVNTLYNSGQPSADISSLSPVNWWKLDTIGTTITDNGSAGNNGTNTDVTAATTDVKTSDLNIPVNGVSTTLPSTALQQSDLQFDSPYSNYSLSFDGASDYLQSASSIDLGINSTISIWFKPSTTVGNYGILIGESSYSNSVLLYPSYLAGSSWIRVTIGTNTQYYNINNITQGIWQNLVLLRSGDTIDMYVNGVLKQTKTGFGTTVTTKFNSISGNSGYNLPGEGSVDEFSAWNSALTEAQLLKIYNNGRPNDISYLSPTSWYRLGENAYFVNNKITAPNSIDGQPVMTGSSTAVTMISADAPGTYANGVGTNLDILDRVGEAPLSVANSQSYNMIPSDISPYVPEYVGDQIANNFSMSFDGVNDYITISNPTELTDDFTIAAWIFPTRVNDGYEIIYAQGTSISAASPYFAVKDTRLHVYITGVYETGLNFITANQWQHVAVTRTSGVLNLYKNGVEYNGARPTQNGTINNNISGVIGNAHSGSYYFKGQIDEVAIFDTALNAGQIYNDIYQPTATGTNQTADLVKNPNLPNPVAWYRMGD